MSMIPKQPLIFLLLLPCLAMQAKAEDIPAPENSIKTAPAQAPVQLGWDRVGDRERNWV